MSLRRPGSGRRRSRRPSAGVPGAGAAGGSPGDAGGTEGFLAVEPGVKLWHRTVGAGGRLLLVPGNGNDVELAALCRPDRRVVFYDSRNRGRSSAVSSPQQAGFGRQVADVGAVGRGLGVDRFVGVGCSYQAAVLVAHALEHPGAVERLVLAAPLPLRSGAEGRAAPEPDPSATARLDQLRAQGLARRDPAAWCRAWRDVYVRPQLGRPEAFERLAPVCDLPNEQPEQVLASVVAVFAELGSYDWRETLRSLTVPTLVITGDADQSPVHITAEWADALPDARLVVLPGVGRFPWVEDPDGFFAAVDDFLA